MMSAFVKIENGAIVEGPGDLPKAYAGISGFNHLSPQELREHGWYPFVAGDEPEFDPRTHRVTWHLEVGAEARSFATVEPLTETEIAVAIEEWKRKLLAQNADYRWQKETGGIWFSGLEDGRDAIPISTSRESQQAVLLAALIGNEKRWKCKDGSWHTLSGNDLAMIQASIEQMKSMAFEFEEKWAERIKGCETFEQLSEIDLEREWNGFLSE